MFIVVVYGCIFDFELVISDVFQIICGFENFASHRASLRNYDAKFLRFIDHMQSFIDRILI